MKILYQCLCLCGWKLISKITYNATAILMYTGLWQLNDCRCGYIYDIDIDLSVYIVRHTAYDSDRKAVGIAHL